MRRSLKKRINEAGQGFPVGELAIALAGFCAAVLHDDELDDLLLEVFVLGEAQGTSEEEGHTRLPPCDRNEMIHIPLRCCPLQHCRQTDRYEG